jgi:hypothetical protein
MKIQIYTILVPSNTAQSAPDQIAFREDRLISSSSRRVGTGKSRNQIESNLTGKILPRTEGQGQAETICPAPRFTTETLDSDRIPWKKSILHLDSHRRRARRKVDS